MQAYVDERVRGGGCRESVLAVQFDALASRLRNTLAGVQIDVSQASSIIAAVTAGPWAEQQRDQLNVAVDTLLASADAKPNKRCQQ